MSSYFVCGVCVNGEEDLVKLFTDGSSLFIIDDYGVDVLAGFGLKFENDKDATDLLQYLESQEMEVKLYANCGYDRWLIATDRLDEKDSYKIINLVSDKENKIETVNTDKFDLYCLDESSDEFYDLMDIVEEVGI